MKTCKTCNNRVIRKIITGPSRRYDYDYQNVCGLDLKSSSYAKVVFKNGIWLESCEEYQGCDDGK